MKCPKCGRHPTEGSGHPDMGVNIYACVCGHRWDEDHPEPEEKMGLQQQILAELGDTVNADGGDADDAAAKSWRFVGVFCPLCGWGTERNHDGWFCVNGNCGWWQSDEDGAIEAAVTEFRREIGREPNSSLRLTEEEREELRKRVQAVLDAQPKYSRARARVAEVRDTGYFVITFDGKLEHSGPTRPVNFPRTPYETED